MRGRVMATARPLIAGLIRPGGIGARGAPVHMRGVPFRPGVPRGGLPATRVAANGMPLRGGPLQRPLVR
jgi:hypothetical protein